MTPPRTPDSVAEVVAWLEAAPSGTQLSAAALRDWLTPLVAPSPPSGLRTGTWRERLWTAPAETRLGVVEVAEAIGRPKSWVYRRTGESATKARLPHRKLDGELVFTAGEIRLWVEQHEAIVARCVRWLGAQARSMDPKAGEPSLGPPELHKNDLASLSERKGRCRLN